MAPLVRTGGSRHTGLAALPHCNIHTVIFNLFYPQKNLQRKEVPLPDFQYYYNRIHAPNSRVNISFCWLNYKEKNPDGYEKSQFYEYYQRFVQENYGGTKISMAVNRKPGEKMYIDWVGDQPRLLTDVTTVEIMRVHIFATTLGVSSMIYAEAFPNEKLPCFIEGCVHAVSFYGAVAKHFVPDNLKTAVAKHTKDDLVLQSTFSDLEDFYDTIVLPPPARKPKGKPTVENHVRYLETHLIEKLKEKIYTSFAEYAQPVILFIFPKLKRKRNIMPLCCFSPIKNHMQYC